MFKFFISLKKKSFNSFSRKGLVTECTHIFYSSRSLEFESTYLIVEFRPTLVLSEKKKDAKELSLSS